MIRKLLGRLVCWRHGHRRGRRIESLDNGRTKRFQCPRCERITEYKA